MHGCCQSNLSFSTEEYLASTLQGPVRLSVLSTENNDFTIIPGAHHKSFIKYASSHPQWPADYSINPTPNVQKHNLPVKYNKRSDFETVFDEASAKKAANPL